MLQRLSFCVIGCKFPMTLKTKVTNDLKQPVCTLVVIVLLRFGFLVIRWKEAIKLPISIKAFFAPRKSKYFLYYKSSYFLKINLIGFDCFSRCIRTFRNSQEGHKNGLQQMPKLFLPLCPEFDTALNH
jgi:hypothetical protein